MAKQPRLVAVITGDIIDSSGYVPADRRRVDRALRRAFDDMAGRFPGAVATPLAFRITAGDEFQCVLGDVPRAFDILLYLRAAAAALGGVEPPVRFRASIGVGGVSLGRRASSYEEDGVAFVRSRRGLDAIARSKTPVRWTALVTGHADTDAWADAILALADRFVQDWTVPQWEAVRWMIVGETRLVAARKLKIAHQNVSKRLLAAGWPYFEAPWRLLGQRLRELPITPIEVQRRSAP